MSQRKNDLSENIYMSFYRPKIGADGIWELPLVLETVSEANGTTIPLPLPYRKLNAEVLEYLEDVAQQMPKGEEARIVVYLPMEQIQPGLSKNSTRSSTSTGTFAWQGSSAKRNAPCARP